MRKIFLFVLIIAIHTQAQTRSLYVDGFKSILGHEDEENRLLTYSQSNKIQVLLLYDLYLFDFKETKTQTNMANFIKKAKTGYNITSVVATGENISFFKDIDYYNSSRSNIDECFDAYNLEFEFWNMDSPNFTNRDYLYNTYLKKPKLSKNVNGAFSCYISILDDLNELVKFKKNKIIIETYIGSATKKQLDVLSSKVDLLRIHAYSSNPKLAFYYSIDRLKDLKNLDVSIIFSAEPNFMKNWLKNNSIKRAENIFIKKIKKETILKNNTINLKGFTYFSYSFMLEKELN